MRLIVPPLRQPAAQSKRREACPPLVTVQDPVAFPACFWCLPASLLQPPPPPPPRSPELGLQAQREEKRTFQDCKCSPRRACWIPRDSCHSPPKRSIPDFSKRLRRLNLRKSGAKSGFDWLPRTLPQAADRGKRFLAEDRLPGGSPKEELRLDGKPS